MVFRALTALTVIALAGFAPAPFPRARSDEEISLDKIQGTWQFVNQYECRGERWSPTLPFEGADVEPMFTEVRITADRMTFYNGRKAVISHRVTIEVAQTPAAIDFYIVGRPERTPWGKGILRRDGKLLRILYAESGLNFDADRPTSFSEKPTLGSLLILRRRG